MAFSSKEFVILLPVILINLILLIIALIDIIRRDKSEVNGENKLPWLLVIIFIQFFGPLSYLIFGKKQ